jgi:hypothetical protein
MSCSSCAFVIYRVQLGALILFSRKRAQSATQISSFDLNLPDTADLASPWWTGVTETVQNLL